MKNKIKFSYYLSIYLKLKDLLLRIHSIYRVLVESYSGICLRVLALNTNTQYAKLLIRNHQNSLNIKLINDKKHKVLNLRIAQLQLN